MDELVKRAMKSSKRVEIYGPAIPAEHKELSDVILPQYP